MEIKIDLSGIIMQFNLMKIMHFLVIVMENVT